MSKKCLNCTAPTTDKDQICPICRATIIQWLAGEIEAMLQYDKRPYKEVKVENGQIIVTIDWEDVVENVKIAKGG